MNKKWVYRKIGPPDVREICVKCGTFPQKWKGDRYSPICERCHNDRHNIVVNKERRIERSKKQDQKRRPYRKYVKDTCDTCGFHSPYPCQFDVDHIDGNHQNNDPTNLQTLCANCHRLKTFLNKDWL